MNNPSNNNKPNKNKCSPEAMRFWRTMKKLMEQGKAKRAEQLAKMPPELREREERIDAMREEHDRERNLDRTFNSVEDGTTH